MHPDRVDKSSGIPPLWNLVWTSINPGGGRWRFEADPKCTKIGLK